MSAPQFTLFESHLLRFLKKVGLDDDWNPALYGNESDIADIINRMQDDVDVILCPDEMTISFNFSDDSDGGAYQWQVYVSRRNFYLGSMFEEMRKIVHDDIVGLPAMAAIIRESVAASNELLRKLTDPRY